MNGARSWQAKITSSEASATYTFANVTSATLSISCLDFKGVNTSSLAAAFDSSNPITAITGATAFNSGGAANSTIGDLGIFALSSLTSAVTFSAVRNNSISNIGTQATCTAQSTIQSTAPTDIIYFCPQQFGALGSNNVFISTASASSNGFADISWITGGSVVGGSGDYNTQLLTGVFSRAPSSSVQAGFTPRAHFGIFIFIGCGGSSSFKEYAPEEAFTHATQWNVDIAETNHPWSAQAADCSGGGNGVPLSTQFPVSQTLLPGESPSFGTVYFTGTHAGLGCNNVNFWNLFHNEATPQAEFYHGSAPFSEANVLNHTGYCAGAGAYLIQPQSTVFQNWLLTNSNSPLFGIPANGGASRDDYQLCVQTTDCPGGLNIGYATFWNGGVEQDCAPIATCVLTNAAALNDALYPMPVCLNGLGGAGFGYSNLNSVPLTVLTNDTKTNDKCIYSESAISDTAGTNKINGAIAVDINAFSQILANPNLTERLVIGPNNQSPNANGALGLRRVLLALSWIVYAEVIPYGQLDWNKVLVLNDIPGGGVSHSNLDIYPEQDIWPAPQQFSVVLPSGQSYIRPYVQGTPGNFTATTGTGCGTITGDVGGALDALNVVGGNSSCGTGSNSKAAGAYSVYYAQAYFQETTGGANINLGHVAAILNTTTSSELVQTSACTSGNICITWMPFTFTNQLQMNVGASTIGELKNAIGGTMACTNCDGTIQSVAVSFPFTLAAGDALILVQNTFGPN